MGETLQRRGQRSPPFSVTGVNLFGPFNLKTGRNRTEKAWGARLTCATVRAIHLEVAGKRSVDSIIHACSVRAIHLKIVEDLSSQSFMHALRRCTLAWPRRICYEQF